MLSREERIFSELLVTRGLIARDLIEGWARAKSDLGPSLAEIVVSSGEIGKDRAEQVLSEARAIDEALAPRLREGTRLGEFRLVREIGRGGMGVVYEAEQESLGRRVAVKVLPAGAADERLAIRFLREARVTARLQHPGIVPVFSSGLAEGVLFFAMELVEGRSLAEVVCEGPMEPRRAAHVIAQVARALDHAHQADLIHRDVKPENILLTKDDRARLTDFGLVHENLAGPFSLSRHVLGTPAYIAPEQALGEDVEPRSDIYGLGAVLYTLLCGKPPYSGEVPSIVLSRVLSEPPSPLVSLHADAPPVLVAICERAMARKPADRYPSAAEMAEDLEAFERGEAPVVAPPVRRRTLLKVLVALAVVAVGTIALSLMRRGPGMPVSVAPHTPKFVLVNSPPGLKIAPTLSPDGKLLAYLLKARGTWEVCLQNLATHETEIISAGSGLAFSPDGHSIAFGREGVAIMDLTTKAVRHVAGPVSGALAWSPDGREIVITDLGGPTAGGSILRIWAVDVASGRIRVVRSMDARAPSYSPHGLRIAFVSFVGGLVDVWTIPPDGGDAVRLTNDPAADWSPFWAPDGRLIYFGSNRSGTAQLWSVGVDEASGRVLGEAEPALPVAFPVIFYATLSADGKRMAIVSHSESGRIFRFPLDPVAGALASRPVALPRNPGAAMAPQPSPDGKFLVYTVLSPEEDLAIMAADGSQEPELLTNDKFDDRAPRWSPDGARIAFHSNRSGSMEVWTVRADGSDLRQVTRTSTGNSVFPVWSPDGKRLAYSVEGKGAFVIASDTAAATAEALPDPGPGLRPFEPSAWSSDGTTLAGSSKGVVLYSIADGSYRRLTDFGEKPVWLAGKRRVLFTSERSFWTLDVQGGAAREIYSAAPSALPPFPGVSSDGRSIYASLTASNEEIWITDFPY